MPIQSKDLLELARRLSAEAHEVAQRAAISRAYYAAYHRCREWEQALPASGDDRGLHGTHERLISRLLKPHASCHRIEASRSRENGEQLQAQRDARVLADYRLQRKIPASLVKEQLDTAAAILRRCAMPAAVSRRRGHPR